MQNFRVSLNNGVDIGLKEFGVLRLNQPVVPLPSRTDTEVHVSFCLLSSTGMFIVYCTTAVACVVTTGYIDFRKMTYSSDVPILRPPRDKPINVVHYLYLVPQDRYGLNQGQDRKRS